MAFEPLLMDGGEDGVAVGGGVVKADIVAEYPPYAGCSDRDRPPTTEGGSRTWKSWSIFWS